MPGPGQYEIKSQFEKKSSDEDDQDADHPAKVPFGSRLEVSKKCTHAIIYINFIYKYFALEFFVQQHFCSYQPSTAYHKY